MQNYFELFDLETSFFISDSNLKDSYRREIARFHPDKYASKTDSEKLQALQNTSHIAERLPAFILINTLQKQTLKNYRHFKIPRF